TLAARHREIDLGQDLRVEQRAVELTLAVVDAVALRKRVQAVALPRMQPARETKRVEHAAALTHVLGQSRQAAQLVVQELHVELGVVNHELGACHEREKLLRHFGELRLRGEKLVLDAVHLERAAIDFALGVDVAVEAVGRDTPVHELDAAELDDAMPCCGLEPSSFRVENDLTHQWRGIRANEISVREYLAAGIAKIHARNRRASNPWFASSSARSFSG